MVLLGVVKILHWKAPNILESRPFFWGCYSAAWAWFCYCCGKEKSIEFIETTRKSHPKYHIFCLNQDIIGVEMHNYLKGLISFWLIIALNDSILCLLCLHILWNLWYLISYNTTSILSLTLTLIRWR